MDTKTGLLYSLSMVKTFRIEIKANGADMGEWEGVSPADALAAMNRSVGGYDDCTAEQPQGSDTNCGGELVCPGLEDCLITEIEPGLE